MAGTTPAMTANGAGKPKKRQPHGGKHLIAVTAFARGGDHQFL
jgi:hypothetical protein